MLCNQNQDKTAGCFYLFSLVRQVRNETRLKYSLIPSNPVLLLSFLMYCFLEISIKAQNLYFTIKQVIRHQTPSSWVTLFLIGLWFIAVSGVFYISNFFITVGLSCVCLKNNTRCIHVSLNLSRKTHKCIVILECRSNTFQCSHTFHTFPPKI